MSDRPKKPFSNNEVSMRALHVISALFILSVPSFADVPLNVGVIVATSTPDVRVDTLVGELVPRDTLTASFTASGRISLVNVEEGDVIKAGALLARMESVQQEQAVRAAEAGVTTSRADFQQAQEDLDRQTGLLARGATTRISRDVADDAFRVAEGGLAQALADLDRAQKALSDTVLYAASAATVTVRMIEPGQVVGAAQPVLELALGGGLDAIFEVPEALLTQSGGSAEIALSLLDQPSKAFSGTVRQVSPLVDATTGTVKVTLTVSGAPSRVSYGDPVRGVARREGEDHVVLPYLAMSTTQAGPAVWVVDRANNTVSLQQVVVERFETGKIVLKGGIANGTLVVTQGAQLLYPGRVVSFLEVSQ
jgi:RND family efflux transporter MFP subunit